MKSNIRIDDPNVDTKTSILIAAEQLFLRYGIRSVSVEDICDSLGISKHIFYTHFADKSTVLEHVCKRKIDEVKSKLNKRQQMADALQEANFLFDEISNFNGGFSTLFFRDLELKHPYIYQLFVNFKIYLIDHIFSLNIKQGIIEGIYRTDVQANVMASLWFDLIAHMYSNNYPLNTVKEHFIRGLLAEGDKTED